MPVGWQVPLDGHAVFQSVHLPIAQQPFWHQPPSQQGSLLMPHALHVHCGIVPHTFMPAHTPPGQQVEPADGEQAALAH